MLERLIGERGRPEILCLDNGPEFTSRRMLGWAVAVDCSINQFRQPLRSHHDDRDTFYTFDSVGYNDYPVRQRIGLPLGS